MPKRCVTGTSKSLGSTYLCNDLLCQAALSFLRRYAIAQCSSQYGRSGAAALPQKRKLGSRGFPIGHWHIRSGAPTIGWLVRLMGDGRDERPRRWAFPITAFRVTSPRCSAIWLALKPSSQSRFSLSTRASVHSIVKILILMTTADFGSIAPLNTIYCV